MLRHSKHVGKGPSLTLRVPQGDTRPLPKTPQISNHNLTPAKPFYRLLIAYKS
jgi:hypothetical protein